MDKRKTSGVPLVSLSKGLSWILRHNAEKEKLKVHDGGFVDVDDILKHQKFQQYTLGQVNEVVATNDKKRFTLRTDPVTNKLQIRANQGHSMEITGLDLEEITSDGDYPIVIHGTYLRFWKSIKSAGLSRMKRNHIHFAPGEPGDSGVISGMRTSVDLYIYVDMKKALNDGIKFFRSQNNVILTQGNEKGILESKYFLKVLNRNTGGNPPRLSTEIQSSYTQFWNFPANNSFNHRYRYSISLTASIIGSITLPRYGTLPTYLVIL